MRHDPAVWQGLETAHDRPAQRSGDSGEVTVIIGNAIEMIVES
jgi:hypothetical protein